MGRHSLGITFISSLSAFLSPFFGFYGGASLFSPRFTGVVSSVFEIL
jgi:hypothetical protein